MKPYRLTAFALTMTLAAATLAAPPNRGGWGPPRADPTDGQNPLDDALEPLAELNLRPDFTLSAEQKQQVQAIRDAFANELASWRAAHADQFRRMTDRFNDLRNGRAKPENGRVTEQWQKLMHERQELLASSPDPANAVDRVAAVLTGDQRQRFQAATDADNSPAATATATPAAAKGEPPFASAVLPLPADGVPKQPGFYKLRFAGQVSGDDGKPKAVRMTYVLFLPKSYRPDGGPYPTLVFLHGSGEVGTDGNGVLIPGLGVAGDIRARAGTSFANDFPMVVVSPQCPPRGERWDDLPILRGTLALLDEAARKVRVDPDRTYLTGLSMGGKGTWLLAGLDPDRFAAIAPLASSTLDEKLAARLRFDAIWTANGEDDIEDGPAHERRMVAAAKAAGGDATATVLPGRDHGIWDDYYRDPSFYQWFLKHRRLTPAERQARLAATRPTTAPAGAVR